ncbi:hypothetical protein BVC80_1075g19 [Macleaya cordata]|uniref:Uncharacterized protein n=1 Tax=Macleaya cordata TaxID=56857 RepID=A0A200PRJ1_MACCD|nr:hypothetical protein BVC80_1075g19 [Macleaya cordata]
MTKIEEEQEEGNEEQEEEEDISVWDCGSPLYDSFELVSLNNLIDRNLAALPFSVGSKRLSDGSDSIRSSLSRSETGSNTTIQWSTSKVGSVMSEPMGRTMLKRKINVERKEKAKRLKIGFRGFCFPFGFWRK